MLNNCKHKFQSNMTTNRRSSNLLKKVRILSLETKHVKYWQCTVTKQGTWLLCYKHKIKNNYHTHQQLQFYIKVQQFRKKEGQGYITSLQHYVKSSVPSLNLWVCCTVRSDTTINFYFHFDVYGWCWIELTSFTYLKI